MKCSVFVGIILLLKQHCLNNDMNTGSQIFSVLKPSKRTFVCILVRDSFLNNFKGFQKLRYLEKGYWISQQEIYPSGRYWTKTEKDYTCTIITQISVPPHIFI